MKNEAIEVYLLAKPQVDWQEISSWVKKMGGSDWVDRTFSAHIESPTELIAEVAGRRCYRSFDVGLNPNVTKIRNDRKEYLNNIISVGHGSVLEHGMFTFAFENISRVVTHELVRHRVGTAISQESMRYVRLEDVPFRHPEFIDDDPELRAEADDLIERMERFQRRMAERTGIDSEGVPFHQKKIVTSSMRRYAPIGLLTGMVWSANVRTLRQVIEARTAEGAEQEIRDLFDIVAQIMTTECPTLFGDFERNYAGEWIPKRSKV